MLYAGIIGNTDITSCYVIIAQCIHIEAKQNGQHFAYVKSTDFFFKFCSHSLVL